MFFFVNSGLEFTAAHFTPGGDPELEAKSAARTSNKDLIWRYGPKGFEHHHISSKFISSIVINVSSFGDFYQYNISEKQDCIPNNTANVFVSTYFLPRRRS